MNIDVIDKKSYCLIRIKDDLLDETDMKPLKTEAQAQLDNGMINIAISFTRNSHIHSLTIAVLIQILGFVKEFGGKLAVVHPNAKILEILEVVGLEKLVATSTSEDSITL